MYYDVIQQQKGKIKKDNQSLALRIHKEQNFTREFKVTQKKQKAKMKKKDSNSEEKKSSDKDS